MDFKRGILYFVLAVLGMMLWHAWQADNQVATSAASAAQMQSAVQTPDQFAPSATQGDASSVSRAAVHATAPVSLLAKPITVKTDVLDAKIDLRGGNLISAKLLQYPVSLQEKNVPVQILNPNSNDLYIAQSGLSVAASESASKPVDFQSTQTSYVLQPNETKLSIVLTGKTAQGLLVQKTFTFYRNDYAIKTDLRVQNTTGKTWQGNLYNQITRRDVPEAGYQRAYSGAAVSTSNTPYKKLSFSDMSDNNFSRDIQNGWIAMQQHYFLSTWIPPKNETLHYYSRSFGHGDDGKNNGFVLGYMSPSLQLAPNAEANLNSTLYVGPEIAKNLQSLGKGLDLTVDYGWLWPISKFLFWVMSEIYVFVGNWGWSIVLVTVFVKIVFHWFSHKSYSSMAHTRDLQPKIKALRDRLGDDKQAMSKAMMELYRKEKVNPLGGCLPMLIQIPVFFALYYVLVESVELRQAPWIFWIHDLSVKDPFYILPVLMGLSMLLQQKLSPPPPDPAQAKMMMFLPVIMTVFFLSFPSGLVLYWFTNNCVSILQQWIAMRMHDRRKQARPN